MSLIPVLLTPALALVLFQNVSLLVYGSDGGITSLSKPSLLVTIEETLSAFVVRRYAIAV
jgi:hypothetical protein